MHDSRHDSSDLVAGIPQITGDVTGLLNSGVKALIHTSI